MPRYLPTETMGNEIPLVRNVKNENLVNVNIFHNYLWMQQFWERGKTAGSYPFKNSLLFNRRKSL
jgi:hypothetical protein